MAEGQEPCQAELGRALAYWASRSALMFSSDTAPRTMRQTIERCAGQARSSSAAPTASIGPNAAGRRTPPPRAAPNPRHAGIGAGVIRGLDSGRGGVAVERGQRRSRVPGLNRRADFVPASQAPGADHTGGRLPQPESGSNAVKCRRHAAAGTGENQPDVRSTAAAGAGEVFEIERSCAPSPLPRITSSWTGAVDGGGGQRHLTWVRFTRCPSTAR